MKYRKKPVVIEAIQWNGNNFDEIKNFANNNVSYYTFYTFDGNGIDRSKLIIKSLEGDMIASEGAFIIKGIKGEFYPCTQAIFEATYEKVD